MAKKARKSRFSGRVAKNLQSKVNAYGYLNIPTGTTIFKEEHGKRARFDIIPYILSDNNHPDKSEFNPLEAGDQWYRRPFKIHRNVGPNNETVVCPTSIGKRCPICEYRAKLFKEGNATDEELKALRTSTRILYNLVPIGHDKFEEKPHLWDISEFNFEALLEEELKEDESFEIFPDIEEGYTLYVRFSSETIGTSKPFAKASKIDFEDRDNPYTEAILDKVANLDEVLQVKTYEQLEAMFFELADVVVSDEEIVEEEEEEVVKPVRKRKAKKVKQSKFEEEEEEDEEDEEEEDEEEEEEEKPKPRKRKTKESAPVRRKKKPTPEPEPEEEEEEEFDDDWDEDDEDWDDEE